MEPMPGPRKAASVIIKGDLKLIGPTLAARQDTRCGAASGRVHRNGRAAQLPRMPGEKKGWRDIRG